MDCFAVQNIKRKRFSDKIKMGFGNNLRWPVHEYSRILFNLSVSSIIKRDYPLVIRFAITK